MSTSAISDLTVIDSFAAQIKAVMYPVSCLQIHSSHNKNFQCIYSKESTQYISCYSSTRLPNWNKGILGSRTNLAKVQTKSVVRTLWYLSFCLILHKSILCITGHLPRTYSSHYHVETFLAKKFHI